MTEQEVRWFNTLSEQRRAFRRTTYENNFDEIWDVITSPYSDQAHFVYELLQNADDCGATEARFELSRDQLLFIHNGTKRFSISDPDRDATIRDQTNGTLGHVNAIVGVKNSTKSVNDIGKFGIGFKSVFLYTSTPRIYDDRMCFMIEDFIVPVPLDEDYPGRKEGTTVFVFPFNRTGENASPNPANDVYIKLQKLMLPTFFLRNLRSITWKYGASEGTFTESVHEFPAYEGFDERIYASLVSLKCTSATSLSINERTDNFLLFSRKLPDNALRYSVAFGLDEYENIKPVHYSPFCYFPTKVDAHLNFVINAPFILTSDRAGISEATDAYRRKNQELLDRCARLLADSIITMRDLAENEGRHYLTDEFVTQQIIPLVEPTVSGWEHLSLGKFYSEPHNVFLTKRVIPCDDGFCEQKDAYAAEYRHMTEAFDNDDLRSFVGENSAQWVFRDIQISEGNMREVNRDQKIRPYIISITRKNAAYTPYDVMQAVQGGFIESRMGDMAWLAKFYKWVGRLSQHMREESKYYRILLNQYARAVSVCSSNGDVQLYLPVEGDTNFTTVHPALHRMPEVKSLENFYELREPSWIDVIGVWIEKAKVGYGEERSQYVHKLIKRGCNRSIQRNEYDAIVAALKNHEVGRFKTQSGNNLLKPADGLYRRNSRLEAIIGDGVEEYCIDEAFYAELADSVELRRLLSDVGVAEAFHLELAKFGYASDYESFLSAIKQLEYKSINFFEPQSNVLSRKINFISNVARGNITNEDAVENARLESLHVWMALNDIVAGTKDANSAKKEFLSIYCYREKHGRADKQKIVESRLYMSLLEEPWIVCHDGTFKKPIDVSTAMLRKDFLSESHWMLVCEILGVRSIDPEKVRKAIEMLPENDQKAYKYGQLLKELGVTNEEDIRRAVELLKREKGSRSDASVSSQSSEQNCHVETGKTVDVEPQETDDPGTEGGESPLSEVGTFERLKDVVDKTVRKTRDYKKGRPVIREEDDVYGMTMLPAADSDPMQPKTVDFGEKIEKLQKKVQSEIDQLKVDAELQETAIEAEEYSYAWLMARLELEMRANGVEEGENREASVSFAKMEREEGAENMFMLSSASDSIPQWFEEEVNQRLTIRIPGRQDIETVIESMSVMSFRLRAKVKILPGMEHIDYSKVTEVKTVATKPSFLLDELRKGYISLGLAGDYNLKENLPEQMRFIFGPPGTGKTTYLARKELIPLAKSGAHPHVLVLTPTNKAADVLTNRIIKECGEDESYKQWLTRFGITLDPLLMGSPVARAKDVEIDDEHSAVVVTTVIRFAYDAFTSMHKEALADFKWDYIVVDEASMIPLMQILYPIYKAKDAKFVIAGDPMQIAPVVMSDLSVGQNIYTMVGLEDFANPTTEPHAYEVVCLDEQFRSVPCIGRIFSEFAYSGKLRHHRPGEEEKDLDVVVDGMPTIKPLTLLRYPVSRFESIFKIKLLGMSSYQIYSALFVFEYICKLVEGLRKAGRVGFRIGVISPYRAQADIVGRLVGKVTRTMLEGVEVNVGTVHSFQGDECEMIIALLNPPQGMGRREGSFINDKKVLNVAISRARDYLVVAIPDAKTPNVQYLRGPLAIAGLMRQTPGVFGEMETPDLEASVWGDRDYVEKNTYSTGHQNVNVYETPEKRFEVRSEDAALDVHFRADRSHVAPDEAFVSERSRIENEVTAEEQARANFVVPEGFHMPIEGERVPAMKQYYVIGNDEPLECESEAEDIDPSQVLAIED